MPDLDFRTFLRPLALPLRLAESAASLLDDALAAVASIAGNRLAGVQRLGEQAWRQVFMCGATPGDLEPVALMPSREDRAAPGTSPRAHASSEIEALVRAVRDPSVEVALAAIEALSLRGDPTGKRALREALANEDGYFDPRVRAAAVTALARLLPTSDLEPVVEAVRDLDADVSAAALSAIGEHAPELALNHATPVLRDRSGYYLPLVRRAAADALLRSGELSPALARELWESEPDPAIRDLLERAGR